MNSVGADATGTSMMGETILVADDEPVVRSYVEGILQRAGFNVIEAVDGVDALRQVDQRHAPIDLLLTDVRMPRMDGIALARSVLERFPKTPVLYISGYSFDLREERALLSGASSAFLPKPFSRQELVGAVQKLLDSRSGAFGAGD
ncbi:MAG TPA: response regulator [Bryobacteraceae bacterium]|nr:response regulator [Bryobacteraceae bacterium]